MPTTLTEAAALPFKIVENLAIPCGYERSFKLVNGHILANRYLLGINTRDTSTQALLDIGHQLQMPAAFLQKFHAGLEEANLVFIGFEADAHGGALYKLYLEYWDRLQSRLASTANLNGRHLLHRGFKWEFDRPQCRVITEYHCIPGLSSSEIRNRIHAQYEAHPNAPALKAVTGIMDAAQQQKPDAQFIYVEVSEAENERSSFDLNLYPAGLTMKQIKQQIDQAAADQNVDSTQLARLHTIIEDKLLGHVSAGFGRDGKEYFTLYYEY